MTIVQPISQVLLSVDKALNDEIITDSGLKLYISPDFKKEWQAAVTATVAALPIKVSKSEEAIISQLKIGDEIAMSYAVVADFEFKGDGHRFMEATEPDRYTKEFINGKGETVRVYGLAKRSGFKGLTWIATYQNKRREVIDGIQGSEEEVERWLSQFPFGKTDEYTFNNLFSYEGRDYWKCWVDQIFAKKVGGRWVAIGDRILCNPVEEDVPEEVIKSIQHTSSVKIRYTDRARVESCPQGINFKKGQIVSFDSLKMERYKFGNKDYYLINHKLVNGIWN